MKQIYTTRGDMDVRDLEQEVTVTNRAEELSIVLEYFYQGELVRRDAHVVKKFPSVTTDALAASIG